MTETTKLTKSQSVGKAVKSSSAPTAKPQIWGRFYDGSDQVTIVLTFLLLMTAPLIVFVTWTSCTFHGCALTQTLQSLLARPVAFFQTYWPTNLLAPHKLAASPFHPSASGWIPTLGDCFALVSCWIAAQAVLYALLPGPLSKGQLTPGGYLLPYITNGFNAYLLTVVLYVVCSFGLHLFPASIIYDAWPGILLTVNIFGYALAAFAFLKAYLFPTHPRDRKFSGSIIYDFFMGIELNPRIGTWWDFKLFFNGRPGIIAWTLINISFAAAQVSIHGSLSNSMLLLNLLQATYVIDFFLNEDWYLRTIDIAHDHFGFYLAWGDLTWLPFMYTLQAHYLVRHPVQLAWDMWLLVAALGVGGYVLFRAVNAQKDQFRKAKDGQMLIWGKPATFIRASYRTAEGESRTSLLLTSGYWGMARHLNYLGDLMLSLAFCLTCGTTHLLPYFYIIYMFVLLLHRIWRDDIKCRGKYGHHWDAYCKQVPYKIVPFVF